MPGVVGNECLGRGNPPTASMWGYVMHKATCRLCRIDSHGHPRAGRLRGRAEPRGAGQPPDAAGFWLGLWQGLISPITFLISLFNNDVNVYEVNNNGNWYDFGFMLGVAIVSPARRAQVELSPARPVRR